MTSNYFLSKTALLPVCRVLVVLSVSMVASVGAAQEVISNGEPPFLQFGKTLTERQDKLSKGEISRYQYAFDKFPTAENCVERLNGDVALERAKIVWKQMHTLEQVNWCVFLLASKLRNAEAIARLFNANEAKSLMMERDENSMRYYQHDGLGFGISVTHGLEGRNRPLRWWSRLLVHSLFIGIVTTSDGVPLSVRSLLTRL